MKTQSFSLAVSSLLRYVARFLAFAAAFFFFSSTLAFGQDAPVDTKKQLGTPDPCTSGHDFATTDCALTWHGIDRKSVV